MKMKLLCNSKITTHAYDGQCIDHDINMDHSMYGFNLLGEALLYNAASHWPSPHPELSLININVRYNLHNATQ